MLLRIRVLGTVVVLMIIGPVLGLQTLPVLLADSNITQTRTCTEIGANLNFTTSTQSITLEDLPIGGGLSAEPRPVILNTVDYAVNVVNDIVLVPDAKCLGPDYKIIGVNIMLKPQYDTTDNGITWRHWVLGFVISDKPFINGTTLDTDLSGQGITVIEISSPSYYDSHDSAMNYIGSSQYCVINLNTDNSTCPSTPTSPSNQLIQIGDTYLAVHPDRSSVEFQVDKVSKGIAIPGNQGNISYQQLLALSYSIITATPTTPSAPIESVTVPSTVYALAVGVTITVIVLAIALILRKRN